MFKKQRIEPNLEEKIIIAKEREKKKTHIIVEFELIYTHHSNIMKIGNNHKPNKKIWEEEHLKGRR